MKAYNPDGIEPKRKKKKKYVVVSDVDNPTQNSEVVPRMTLWEAVQMTFWFIVFILMFPIWLAPLLFILAAFAKPYYGARGRP